jgi:hypothetical protein
MPLLQPRYSTYIRHFAKCAVTGVTVLTVRANYRYYAFQKHQVISLYFLRNNSSGRSLPLYIPKASIYFHCFSHKRSLVNIVGRDQELWMIYRGKRHFKERCIQYNYTIFIWVLCQGQRKWRCLWEIMHTGTMDRGFTVIQSYKLVCSQM